MASNSNNNVLDREALSMEYNKLKDEIIKRIELRQQLLAITLAIMGVILTIALQNNNPEIALIYPPIAALMALLWIQNDSGIRNAAGYILKIEDKISTLGFENYKIDIRASGGLKSIILFASHGGIFLATQVLTVFVSHQIDDSIRGNVEPLFYISYLSVAIVVSIYIYWWHSGKSFRTPRTLESEKK